MSVLKCLTVWLRLKYINVDVVSGQHSCFMDWSCLSNTGFIKILNMEWQQLWLWWTIRLWYATKTITIKHIGFVFTTVEVLLVYQIIMCCFGIVAFMRKYSWLICGDGQCVGCNCFVYSGVTVVMLRHRCHACLTNTLIVFLRYVIVNYFTTRLFILI